MVPLAHEVVRDTLAPREWLEILDLQAHRGTMDQTATLVDLETMASKAFLDLWERLETLALLAGRETEVQLGPLVLLELKETG